MFAIGAPRWRWRRHPLHDGMIIIYFIQLSQLTQLTRLTQLTQKIGLWVDKKYTKKKEMPVKFKQQAVFDS